MYQKGTLTVYHAINSGQINLLTVLVLFDEVVMETYFPEMTLNPPINFVFYGRFRQSA